MNKLLVSASAIALTISCNASAGTITYPPGMTANTPVTSFNQVQQLYNSVVAAAEADGLVPKGFVVPGLTDYADGLGDVGFVASSNTIDLDPSAAQGKFTASEVASDVAHELGHALDPDAQTGDTLQDIESADSAETYADSVAVELVGATAFVNSLSVDISVVQADTGDSLDVANAALSDADHGTPYQRAEAACPGCALPADIVPMVFEATPGEEVNGGVAEQIPEDTLYVAPSGSLTTSDLDSQQANLESDTETGSPTEDGGGAVDEEGCEQYECY